MVFGQVVNANLIYQSILVFFVGDDNFALFTIYATWQMAVSLS